MNARVSAVEVAVHGAATTGGMLNRVAVLEEVLLGSAQTGGLPDRLAALETIAGVVAPQPPHRLEYPGPLHFRATEPASFAPLAMVRCVHVGVHSLSRRLHG